MSDVAIRVEGLGKRFRLRHQGGAPRYRTLREDLLAAPREWWARLRRRAETEEFWALKDVSFEVKRGEVLGIIGRNGAGKSTLLKILSRIMDPTEGEATVYGRIGSLLEVGTGFHPELTGRENIFLSGALLGMKRDEVRRRFDEIVEFAGVEKFLDTPCKHYSSGMYTRLGFAVAAHLDTEILLVDEVLAVGDAEFQRKCLDKMQSVAAFGRTVLLVTHNMAAVTRMCTSAMVLTAGREKHWGMDVSGATGSYLSVLAAAGPEWSAPDDGLANRAIGMFTLRSLRLVDRNGKLMAGAIPADEPVTVEINGVVNTLHTALCLGVAVYTADETALFWSYQTDVEESSRPILRLGSVTLRAELPTGLLNTGRYRVEFLASLHCIEWIAAPQCGGPSVWLEVSKTSGNSPFRQARKPVLLDPVLRWVIEPGHEEAECRKYGE
jgi:lipopolysaccharide transport system ATP-binding protein